MKRIIFRTIAILVAIGLAFTPFWEWTAGILLIVIAEWTDKNKKPRYNNPLDKFI